MKTAIILISEEGRPIAQIVEKELSAQLLPRNEVGSHWHRVDAFVFIGAMGICVRTIAPFIEDKHTDPAVVCIDATGRHVISVLSGHVGGANALSETLASALGTQSVITTQSDNLGLWALDTLAKQYDWQPFLPEGQEMNTVIAAFVGRQPTALLLDIRDRGTDFMEANLPRHVTVIRHISEASSHRFRLLIAVSPYIYDAPAGIGFIQYIPRVLWFGIGLAHQAPLQSVMPQIDEQLRSHGFHKSAGNICTIDLKADEPVIRQLQQEGYPTTFFTAEALSSVAVPTPSATVERHVGTPSVSEASAILASRGGRLLLPKVKGKDFTLAVALAKENERAADGHIEIVGAGPGDPDLVSVRGRKLLEQADLILYAGSLVPRELTLCHKPGAVVRSSAGMNLDEQCALMKEFYDRGQFIVRLHTGDPCIFGAIQEQMTFFDRHQMSYHITPGISSFLAAAAELRSQFTIPERCQTIILTRGEGRTPMPEREKLHLLARSQSTMCIFLSAAIVDDVQAQLLQEYPETTPVAACYHLTWPDQRIYRGQLKDLARIVRENGLTLTTMIVVGEAIDNRAQLSRLYDRHFTHLFRAGVSEDLT